MSKKKLKKNMTTNSVHRNHSLEDEMKKQRMLTGNATETCMKLVRSCKETMEEEGFRHEEIFFTYTSILSSIAGSCLRDSMEMLFETGSKEITQKVKQEIMEMLNSKDVFRDTGLTVFDMDNENIN